MRTEAVCRRKVNSGMNWVLRTGRQCIAAEQARGLSTRSLVEEIERWIHHKRKGLIEF